MSVTRPANRFVREVLHPTEAPLPATARFFYTSHQAIDDPLSPLPPLASTGSAPIKQPPRPFSAYDNENLEKAWRKLRRELLEWNEEEASEKRKFRAAAAVASTSRARSGSAKTAPRKISRAESISRSGSISQRQRTQSRVIPFSEHRASLNENQNGEASNSPAGSFRALALEAAELEGPATTGTPFIRAPSRTKLSTIRPTVQPLDSYEWDADQPIPGTPDRPSTRQGQPETTGPSAKVPVGVSRLHSVLMPQLQMEPIYWSPINDISAVVRATWFYKDTMLPVEVDVANMLEAGYTTLQPWTQTWVDELNSAVEVGALGEMKIVHKLWPEKSKTASRPSTAMTNSQDPTGNMENGPLTAQQEQEETVNMACDMIDITSGADHDNKASGTANFGRDGTKRIYPNCGVIYANDKEAYILRSKLQPSDYYGRRPLANYIRRGRQIGVCVVRGFDQKIWDKLNPPPKGSIVSKAQSGVSTSGSGEAPGRRIKNDPDLALSERPQVTDLVLVIHGIGQKLSERMESFHFTHAINAFRRDVNVELGTDTVKAHLRKDMGGMMVLPVNWRLSLSFEDGGYRDESASSNQNSFALKDITPDSLPSVRNIISDVMLDVPYYLSTEHHSKMVAACIREANRIYRLWCANNPGFERYGRVHVIAHSLGSVMALDILSNQPTHVSPDLGSPNMPEEMLPTNHFLFDTHCAFLCGSPAGFFLLLKNSTLLPRRGRDKPGAEDVMDPSVVGEQYTYGCLAVDNLYNIINPYDPIAYRMNATVDATYSAALKPAFIPSATKGWFSNPFRSSVSSGDKAIVVKPHVPRLPSTVELETHNFSREEIAERKAYLLNDNGQIDYYMKYGGGALEIQYLTMLGAHSSYWLSVDFTRMIVQEIGRPFGRQGTLLQMRAEKKKQPV